jgi:hypothetical protein
MASIPTPREAESDINDLDLFGPQYFLGHECGLDVAAETRGEAYVYDSFPESRPFSKAWTNELISGVEVLEGLDWNTFVSGILGLISTGPESCRRCRS